MDRLWLCFLLAALHGLHLSGVHSAGPRKNIIKENPIDKIPIQKNFNLDQLTGKWFLIGVASKCEYLRENNFRVEGTSVVLSRSSTQKIALDVSTLRKLDLQCWDIRQEYCSTKTNGRLLLKGRGSGNDVDIVVGETDYQSYAILYYQQRRKITVKLYGRSSDIPDNIIDKFQEAVLKQNIGEDFIYYFPKYGFCESADEFHILRE
ncbi:complement component C8 gamma chain-like [Huso huso]